MLKGESTLKGKTIKINIQRFEMGKADKNPLISIGVKSILFLKKIDPDTPSWVTTDFWFGVQRPSPWMARSLKRLSTKPIKMQKAQ